MIKIRKFPFNLLHKQGIKIGGIFDGEFRFVTNRNVTRDDCYAVVNVLRGILETNKH